MPLISTTNPDGSIVCEFREDAPSQPADSKRDASDVDINGTFYSRADIESAAASQKIKPLPDLDSAYVPQSVSAERFSINMGGDPISTQRDQITREANRWLERVAADAYYDDNTKSFQPRNPQDREAVQRVRVGVLNLQNTRRQLEYLSAQSELAHAQRGQPVQLSARDQEMLKKAEENGAYVVMK